MQRRLAAQEQSRRTFVSTASHELRTPLTSLGLMLHGATEELAHEQPDLPEARDQLRRALGQTDRLSKLAAELLDLSRLDAGVELRAEPVELVELARSVLAEFAAGESRAELSADGPTWVLADPGAVARIARILLNNAHRHGEGRVVVRVEPCALEVSDDGPGVPPGEEERIFERFRRGAEAGEDGGFGLGLAIGRELAEQMGGELRLVGTRDVPRHLPRRRGRLTNRAGPSQHGPNMMLTTARSPPGTIGRDAPRPCPSGLSGPLRPDLRGVRGRPPPG